MRFLVDAHLSPVLARWLVAHGHTADHVAERGLQAAPDTTIWDFALAEGAVILTKDEDFAQRRVLAVRGPPIVWIRLPNTRRRSARVVRAHIS